ncbi:hypothetical protein ACHZ97_14765 [Lysobacter soli]|uniref:hypothetical protein n=1 Tax=Lysobacter soli TaxID=453783 RepID=UPI0037C92CD3
MATRFAKETGRNWTRFDRPACRADVLIGLGRMRRVPRASAAFDYYTAHRARCFRPVALPRAALAAPSIELRRAA